MLFKNLLLYGTEGVLHRIIKEERMGRGREGEFKMSSAPLNSNFEGTKSIHLRGRGGHFPLPLLFENLWSK
jgi:hypothetical protein